MIADSTRSVARTSAQPTKKIPLFMSSKTFLRNNCSRCRINVLYLGLARAFQRAGLNVIAIIAPGADVTSQVVGADLVDPSADLPERLAVFAKEVACLFRSNGRKRLSGILTV